jgi:hypothetical protein
MKRLDFFKDMSRLVDKSKKSDDRESRRDMIGTEPETTRARMGYVRFDFRECLLRKWV